MARVYSDSSAPTPIDLGGWLLCIGEPRDVPAMPRALEAAGARILDFGIERDGLKIEIREAAAAR
jgi:hypothetical protein